jgi:hypothetical protein
MASIPAVRERSALTSSGVTRFGRGLGIEGLDGTLERGSNLLIVKGAEVFGKLERLGHVRDS